MRKPKKPTLPVVALILALLALTSLGVYQIPSVNQRLSWRVDIALTYLRGVLHPAGAVPTPIRHTDLPTQADTQTATPTPAHTATSTPIPTLPTPTFTPSPTPIPASASLPPPAWVLQDPNNCGPASLAMYLGFYGWQGTQQDISDLIKPLSADRNVNVEELVYYVRTRAGWLNAEFRVGGDLALLKQLIAVGFPVMIEESFYFEETFWPNDDKWAAHYQLLTAYDDATQTFTGQDSFHGPDLKIPYATLDEYWQIFNRVYILIYPPDRQAAVQSILGPQWDADANRRHALEIAQAEAEADPQNAFAWFNIGSNQVYFGNYGEAAAAYDTARELGLPQRMLRYQFGPFFAYFHTGQYDDLLALTSYALERTPNSEEALLWYGWGLFRQGDQNKAITEWRKALEANPFYQDARYALEFVGSTP